MAKRDLRKAARGRECQVRIPGVCNGNTETTVLAHVRRGGVGGMGMKPPDVCGVVACSDCHDVMDRRRSVADYPGAGLIGPPQVDEYVFDAMCRTLAMWHREGLL